MWLWFFFWKIIWAEITVLYGNHTVIPYQTRSFREIFLSVFFEVGKIVVWLKWNIEEKIALFLYFSSTIFLEADLLIFLNNCLMCHLSFCVDGFFSNLENTYIGRTTDVLSFLQNWEHWKLFSFVLNFVSVYIHFTYRCLASVTTYCIFHISISNLPTVSSSRFFLNNRVLVQNYEVDKITLENNFSLADSTSKNTNHTTLEMGNALTKTVGAK